MAAEPDQIPLYVLRPPGPTVPRPPLTDEERSKIAIGLQAVADFEAEFGAFTEEELARADRVLYGDSPPPPRPER